MDINDCCSYGYCALDDEQNFHCCECGKIITDENILTRERKFLEEIAKYDFSTPDDMINRGVSVRFLLDFTHTYDLWDKTTAWVTRHIIKPATEATRKRFVELDNMEVNVGVATSFVSHCWNGLWGTLVAAVTEHADPDKFVWIDIFAVRQWPSPNPDLNFRAVIRAKQCTSFILVCCSHPDVTKMNTQTKTSRDMTKISDVAKKEIAFFRVWCLVEIAEAVKKGDNMAFALKAGTLEKNSSEGIRLNPDPLMISNLFYFVDIRHADATFAHDRDRILQEIEADNGFEAVNRAIRGVCAGSRNASRYPIVQAAGCGNRMAAEIIFNDPQAYLPFIAGAGYWKLLEEIFRRGTEIDVNAKDEFTCTPLIQASRAGHLRCIQILLNHGADVNIGDKDRVTPFISAAIGGHLHCLQELAHTPGVDVRAENIYSSNAITYAAVGGYDECLEYLIKLGLNINARSTRTGWTPLTNACNGNHVKCANILLSRPKCEILIKDSEGKTCLEKALENNSIACYELVQEELRRRKICL